MAGIGRNIVFNYVAAISVALGPVVTIPWYLSALGSMQWGLISFIYLLQVIMGLLDGGMSQALSREFAMRFQPEKKCQKNAASLLVVIEKIYWLFSIIIAVIFIFLARYIATNWLALGAENIYLGVNAIYGGAFLFIAQFSGSVYRSVLVGTQYQVLLSKITIFVVVFRHGVGVFIVLFWPHVEAYLIWQILISSIETGLRRFFAWKIIGVDRKNLKNDVADIVPVLNFSVRMSGAVLMGALSVNMDKIIVSKMLSVDQFGYYAIAVSIAVGVMQLVSPIVQAMHPRLVVLRNDVFLLKKQNVKFLLSLVLLVFLGWLVYLLFGTYILTRWLGNEAAVVAITPVVNILAIGTTVNTLAEVGYANWIVFGRVGKVAQRNILALLCSVLLLPYLIRNYGLEGAAFSWVINSLIVFIMSSGWFFEKVNEK